MGCDIHLHIEVKVNGKWEHYSHPHIQRNYGLFAFMAGVRQSDGNPLVPIAEPRGLPTDLSVITKIDYAHDEPDSHSESWLNRDEIRRVCEFMMERPIGPWAGEWEHTQLGYANGNAYWTVGDDDEGHPAEYEDIRFVFWFDN